jgi:hypothetical protein
MTYKPLLLPLPRRPWPRQLPRRKARVLGRVAPLTVVGALLLLLLRCSLCTGGAGGKVALARELLAGRAGRAAAAVAWYQAGDVDGGEDVGEDDMGVVAALDAEDVPGFLLAALSTQPRRQLLSQMRRRLRERSAGAPYPLPGYAPTNASALPRLLILHVQNGLGNRLRALGSGLEFALATGRVPVVVWARDPHLDAGMAELFDPCVLRALVTTAEDLPWPLLRSLSVDEPRGASPKFVVYNRMEKYTGAVREPIPAADSVANTLLQQLVPVAEVLERVAYVESVAGPLNRRVGVHMRSRTVQDDGVAVDLACEYSARGVAVADGWRAASSPARFAPAMRAQLARRFPTRTHRAERDRRISAWAREHPVQAVLFGERAVPKAPEGERWVPGFFVSADVEGAVAEVGNLCGAECQVIGMRQECLGRGAKCVIGAFADLVALSRCGALLLSGWSSFSEAAWRLRRVDADEALARELHGEVVFPLRVSGADFGAPSLLGRVSQMLDYRRWAWWQGIGDFARRKRCSGGAGRLV